MAQFSPGGVNSTVFGSVVRWSMSSSIVLRTFSSRSSVSVFWLRMSIFSPHLTCKAGDLVRLAAVIIKRIAQGRQCVKPLTG